MANPEHLKILKEGVEVWNKWREENPEVRPDLSGAEIGSEKPKSFEFKYSSPTTYTSPKSDFVLIKLEPGLKKDIMSRLVLENINFNNCNLNGANLRKVQFRNALFKNANLSDADLSEANLYEADFSGALLAGAELTKADLWKTNFSDADMSNSRLPKAMVFKTIFSNAKLIKADVRNIDWLYPILDGCDFSESDLSGTDFSDLNLQGVKMQNTNLSGSNLKGSNLKGVDLRYANLQNSLLIEASLEDANISGSKIYGISVWNLEKNGIFQKDLIITPTSEPEITVDDIEVAQFIYLLLNNQKIRDVIETITSKAVLILGRFTPERKAVLDAIKDELRLRNYLPIVFDFENASGKSVDETVNLLARMSRFVIADITDAKSIPQELRGIVPDNPSIPIVPLILKAQREYGIFDHFRNYPWVLPLHEYESPEQLMRNIIPTIIAPVEQKVLELKKKS